MSVCCTMFLAPGVVGNLRAHLVDDSLSTGEWTISFRPPLHPNGEIIRYHYEVYIGNSVCI